MSMSSRPADPLWSSRTSAPVRLAEFVGALALASDLGMGQPMDHGLRTCLLALRLGVAIDLDRAELDELFYVALLRWSGCTANAHDTAALFGDDIGARRQLVMLDPTDPADAGRLLREIGRGEPLRTRALRLGRAATAGRGVAAGLVRTHCEAAQGLARRLHLAERVQTCVGQLFERFDGRGQPESRQGSEIDVLARIVPLAGDAELLSRSHGAARAAALVGRRAGGMYDPDLAPLLAKHLERWLAEIGEVSPWSAVLAAEPGDRPILAGAGLDAACEAAADFVDVKVPALVGHSRAVAELAAAAGTRLGWPAKEITAVRRAGLLHDLGRVAVSNAVWEKAGPLTEAQWESVRLHTYYTERALARSPVLASLGAIAAAHHERCDASGYHRGLPAPALPMAARVLAAADCYQAMTEARPHRPARPAPEAARELRDQVRIGRLDGATVEAVLAAAGHTVRLRVTRRAGLTAREAEVLGLLARGATNREIAAALVLSVRTVDHHVEHTFAKIGVSTRAAATLFALQHGLVAPSPPPGPDPDR